VEAGAVEAGVVVAGAVVAGLVVAGDVVAGVVVPPVVVDDVDPAAGAVVVVVLGADSLVRASWTDFGGAGMPAVLPLATKATVIMAWSASFTFRGSVFWICPEVAPTNGNCLT
jgi:hypothetical protein